MDVYLSPFIYCQISPKRYLQGAGVFPLQGLRAAPPSHSLPCPPQILPLRKRHREQRKKGPHQRAKATPKKWSWALQKSLTCPWRWVSRVSQLCCFPSLLDSHLGFPGDAKGANPWSLWILRGGLALHHCGPWCHVTHKGLPVISPRRCARGWSAAPLCCCHSFLSSQLTEHSIPPFAEAHWFCQILIFWMSEIGVKTIHVS